MTFTEEGQTLSGESPTSVALALAALGVDVIGSNCSVGPAGIEDTIHEMAAALPDVIPRAIVPLLSAQPNAGCRACREPLPLRLDASLFRRLCAALRRGRRATDRRLLRHDAIAYRRDARRRWRATCPDATTQLAVATPRAERRRRLLQAASNCGSADEGTRLRRTLEAGRFVVSAELDPPKGLNPPKILDGAAHLKSRASSSSTSPIARWRACA